jgi:hypothetical protein
VGGDDFPARENQILNCSIWNQVRICTMWFETEPLGGDEFPTRENQILNCSIWNQVRICTMWFETEPLGGGEFPTRENQILEKFKREPGSKGNLTKNTMDGSNRNTQLLIIFGKVRKGTYASSTEVSLTSNPPIFVHSSFGSPISNHLCPYFSRVSAYTSISRWL